jgi:hypothetical protein
MQRSSRVTFAFVLAAGMLAACGGSSSSPDAGDVVNCQTDPRVATYAPNMSVKSSGGTMTFTLVQSNPAPPGRGNDTWIIHLSDVSGQALTNLSLSVLPFMPDHGHGTAVNATVTANGGGDYTVTPLYFFMPGVWRIRFTSSGSTETTDFWFCIPG